MYVRMITYHPRPGVEQRQATAVYDELIQSLEHQDGYQGCALLLSEDMSAAISLTYWQNEECAANSGGTVLPLLFERASDLSDRPPEITGYHVLDHQLKDE